MPHSDHEAILQRLSLTADRVMDALRQMDMTALDRLSQEQAALLNELSTSGQISDRVLEDRLQALLVRIQEVEAAIETRRHEISVALKQIADGRKMIRAYGK